MILRAKESFFHSRSLSGNATAYSLADSRPVRDFYSRIGSLYIHNTQQDNGEHSGKIDARSAEFVGIARMEAYSEETHKNHFHQVEVALRKAEKRIQDQKNKPMIENISEIVAEACDTMLNEFFYGIGTISVVKSHSYKMEENITCTWVRCFECMNAPNCIKYKAKPGSYNEKMIKLDGYLLHYSYPYTSKQIVGPIFERVEPIMKDKIQALLDLISTVTELQTKTAQAEHLAYFDSRTDLPNRHRLKDDVEKAEKCGEKPTILFIEVPDYSTIINTVGGDGKWEERIRQTIDTLHKLDELMGYPIGTIYRRDDYTLAIVSDKPEYVVQAFVEALPKGSLSFHMGMVADEEQNTLLKASIALLKAKKERGAK